MTSSDSDVSVSFVIGEKFSSYENLKDKISAYESTKCVQLYHSDSRTLEAAKNRVPCKVAKANHELVYYCIDLACVFGGRKYRNRGSGKRPHQSTIRQECKAVIKLSLSDDGQSLVVTGVNENHNHDISKAIYDHLPRQRMLDVKMEAEGLLKMKVELVSAGTIPPALLQDLEHLSKKYNAKLTVQSSGTPSPNESLLIQPTPPPKKVKGREPALKKRKVIIGYEDSEGPLPPPSTEGDDLCQHCRLSPCVINRPPNWLRGSAGPHIRNLSKRFPVYKRFRTLLGRLGVQVTTDGRDVLPLCVVTEIRRRFPNPYDIPYSSDFQPA